MSARLPLNATSRTNEARMESDGRGVDEKLRVRSVTDKPKDVLNWDETSRLKMEIEALRARVARRDETISKLQARAGGADANRDIQNKLQDLMQRHSEAKTKHRSDLDAIMAENTALRKDAENHRAKEASLAGKLTDVRSKLALSEAETVKLRQEASSRPSSHTGLAEDRIAWNKAKMSMESEIKKLEKEVERGSRKLTALQEKAKLEATLAAENERLKFGWNVMTEQYGELYDKLQEVRRDALEREHADVRYRQEKESEVARLAFRLERSGEDQHDLLEQLGLSRKHVDQLSMDLEEQLDLHHAPVPAITRPLNDNTVEQLQPMTDIDSTRTMLELATGHAGLQESIQRDGEEHITHLTTSIIELEQSVRDLHTRLTTTENTHVLLVAEQESLRAEHAPCGASLSQLRFEVDQANRIVDSRGQEVNDVRLELCRANERSERQADLLQRANENVSRSKFAQDALEEEVETLRTKFIEAAGFEEQYNNLLERQQLLETREAVAIEQAERVAMENAELMGHTTGSQKIGYVDGVRREIALCRQELAATRHHLNIANDRIVTLESEIAAYKTISPESALPASRTRVVRRQPEGGRLTASLSASGARRISVTGPGGAKRLI